MVPVEGFESKFQCSLRAGGYFFHVRGKNSKTAFFTDSVMQHALGRERRHTFIASLALSGCEPTRRYSCVVNKVIGSKKRDNVCGEANRAAKRTGTLCSSTRCFLVIFLIRIQS